MSTLQYQGNTRRPGTLMTGASGSVARSHHYEVTLIFDTGGERRIAIARVAWREEELDWLQLRAYQALGFAKMHTETERTTRAVCTLRVVTLEGSTPVADRTVFSSPCAVREAIFSDDRAAIARLF